MEVGPRGEVADPEGQLAAGLGIAGTALLVVRPDKYLGLATDRAGAAEIEAYLTGLIG